jgi:hypothetical protein
MGQQDLQLPALLIRSRNVAVQSSYALQEFAILFAADRSVAWQPAECFHERLGEVGVHVLP